MLRLFGPGCPTSAVEPDKLEAVPPGVLWIDLLNPTREEEKLAEKVLGQNIPTREEMAEIEASSRLYQEDGATFMTATVVSGADGNLPTSAPVGRSHSWSRWSSISRSSASSSFTPPRARNLMPLSGIGLCDAEITTPTSAPRASVK